MFGHFLPLALLWAGPDSLPVPAEVRLLGTVHASPVRVFREIEARPGEPCDSLCQAEDLDRLERLGIFADQRVERVGDTLVYQVRELPWILPVPNGRITQEEGISLGAGVKAPDLFGQAVAGEFLFLAGSDFEWQASLSSGRLGPVPVRWDAHTERTQRWDDARDYRELSYTTALTLSAPSDGPLRLLGQGSLVRVHSNRPGIALSADQADWIPSLRGAVVWDDRDRMGLTTRGAYQEVSLEKAGRPFDGPVDAWELLSDTRLWIPLGAGWGIHASHLLERQWGTVGGWRTFVVGGVNTVRGLPSAWSVEPSEQLATLELRWLFLPVRPFSVWGQDLYGGLQAVCGTDYARTWDGGGREAAHGASALAGLEVIVPYVERVRLDATWSPVSGAGFSFQAGLFEKSQAQRYRVR